MLKNCKNFIGHNNNNDVFRYRWHTIEKLSYVINEHN